MKAFKSNAKYIIPLDMVDFPILPSLNVSSKHCDVVLPIWSRSNLKQRSEDCYYEFEVKDEQDISDTDTYDSSSDSVSNPEVNTEIGTNICYMCNLEVPIPYMGEHINSLKHKTFLKITEIASERVKKQIIENYPSEKLSPSMYFCHTCVAVVPVKDKFLHFKSKAHKNALILDKLLNDLLIMYSDEPLETDDCDEYEIELPKYVEPLKIINRTLTATTTKNCNGIDANVPNVVMPVEFNIEDATKEIIHDQKADNAFENVNKNSTVTHGDPNLTKLDISNSHTVSASTLENTNGEYLKIETNNANSLKAKYDKSHNGIVRIGGEPLQSKLCTEIIKKEIEDIDSPSHTEEIALPTKDKQCIRELGDPNTISHCVLYDDLIENADIHSLCNDAQLKKAIYLPEEDIKSKNGIEIMWTELEKSVLEIDNEKQNEELLHKCDVVQCHSNDVMKTELITTKYSSIEQDNEKQSELLLQNEEFDKNKLDKAKYSIREKYYDEQSAFQVKKNSGFQDDYNRVTVIPEFKENKNPVIEKENLNHELLQEKPSAFDVTSIFEKEDETPSKYLESDDVVLTIAANDNKISKPKEFFCSLCYIKIHTNDLHTHTSGAKHKENEKLDFHYLLEHYNETNELKCKICNSFINTKFIKAHLMNTDHSNKYDALLTANKMTKSERNVHCEVCLVYMRVGNELIHLNSTKHKMLLLKLKNVSSRPVKEIYFEKVTAKDNKPHLCDVCQVQVPNNTNNINTHYNGNSHKKKLAEYFSSKTKLMVQGHRRDMQDGKNIVGILRSSSNSNRTKTPKTKLKKQKTAV